MAIIFWNQQLSVKIKQFDEQHKKLIDMVNRLHDSMKQGKGSAVLGPLLDELVAYTVTHFDDEERLMRQHNYSGFPQHKSEHEKLTRQALELQKQYRSNPSALSVQVMTFLKDWLSSHIQGDDKKYGPFLNSKGVV
jgi:hemerythrin